jgi:hypothetical protein
VLANLGNGQSFEVHGVYEGEVLSVESDALFTSSVTLGTPPPPPPPTAPGDIRSVVGFWFCNPGCYGADWPAHVLTWPSWSAWESNGRDGNYNRTVYNANGQVLYPFMGPWASGCRVTVKSGRVLIIEWKRGTNIWRSTPLTAGQSYTIQLAPPEDSAVIETDETMLDPFTVTLSNCNPQMIQK